jgi:hypothetical protein
MIAIGLLVALIVWVLFLLLLGSGFEQDGRST